MAAVPANAPTAPTPAACTPTTPAWHRPFLGTAGTVNGWGNGWGRVVVRVLPLMAVVALGAVGCSSATPDVPPSPASAGTAAAADFTVGGYRFPAFTASPGQKITIADKDGEPHTVTADDGSFDSGSFDGSAPGSLTAPTKPGLYPIHCKVHPSMHGTLTVR